MADTARLTVHLPKEDLQRLEALAQARGQSTAVLAPEAVAAYLVALVRSGVRCAQAVAADEAAGRSAVIRAVAPWLRPAGRVNWQPPLGVGR